MFIFLLSCILISCVSSQPSGGLHDGPIEAECLSFLRRERIWVPLALEQVAGPSTGPDDNPTRLARHHIIPVRTLRSFFDTAMAMNHEGNLELTGLMNLMGFLSEDALNLYEDTDAISDYIRSDLQEMRRLQELYIDQELNLNNPPVDILFSAQYLVRSMYQWMPANIFIGPEPRLRSDDPGDSFEVSSSPLIGEDAYQRLVTINRMMTSYVETRERATYNEIIELLSEISRGRNRPYPYIPDQWTYDAYNKKFKINPNPNNRKKRAANVTFVDNDSYCFKPIEKIKLSIKNDNIKVIAKAVDRAIKNKGFYSKNYNSWKEWYADSSWEFGIYGDGISMSGIGWVYRAYGYKFNDNSFSVGVLGIDANNETDNWVDLSHDFRDTQKKRDYAGQAFFDKDGRPVAIVITSLQWSQVGAGWSFIYINGKWEYEWTDNWDQRRFPDSSLSLDQNALKFVQS